MQRIELLQSFIVDDPKDPFNCYGLALEYQKLGDARSNELFDKLLTDFSDYLPTYYTAAKHFESSDSLKAKGVYQKGIELAQQQNNNKALNELKTALFNLEFED